MPFLEVDRRILTRCLKHEPGAWEEFVDRFIGVFVHVIRHTAHARSVEINDADIEDLCSEIYLTLLKNDFAVLRHFKGRSSLATYLAVVARRIAVKSITQRRKSEALGHTVGHPTASQTAMPPPGKANEETGEPSRTAAEIEQVRALMSQLPASEATLVKLFYLEGLSYREISRRTNIPENSIGPTLHRARERMRKSKLPSVG